MHTEREDRRVSIVDLVRWMAAKPAEAIGLSDRKGALQVGGDADFVVFDPTSQFLVSWSTPHTYTGSIVAQVTKDRLKFKNKLSPYEGRKLRGEVLQTYLRGELIFEHNKVLEMPRGRMLID